MTPTCQGHQIRLNLSGPEKTKLLALRAPFTPAVAQFWRGLVRTGIYIGCPPHIIGSPWGSASFGTILSEPNLGSCGLRGGPVAKPV